MQYHKVSMINTVKHIMAACIRVIVSGLINCEKSARKNIASLGFKKAIAKPSLAADNILVEAACDKLSLLSPAFKIVNAR